MVASGPRRRRRGRADLRLRRGVVHPRLCRPRDGGRRHRLVDARAAGHVRNRATHSHIRTGTRMGCACGHCGAVQHHRAVLRRSAIRRLSVLHGSRRAACGGRISTTRTAENASGLRQRVGDNHAAQRTPVGSHAGLSPVHRTRRRAANNRRGIKRIAQCAGRASAAVPLRQRHYRPSSEHEKRVGNGELCGRVGQRFAVGVVRIATATARPPRATGDSARCARSVFFRGRMAPRFLRLSRTDESPRSAGHGHGPGCGPDAANDVGRRAPAPAGGTLGMGHSQHGDYHCCSSWRGRFRRDRSGGVCSFRSRPRARFRHEFRPALRHLCVAAMERSADRSRPRGGRIRGLGAARGCHRVDAVAASRRYAIAADCPSPHDTRTHRPHRRGRCGERSPARICCTPPCHRPRITRPVRTVSARADSRLARRRRHAVAGQSSRHYLGKGPVHRRSRRNRRLRSPPARRCEPATAVERHALPTFG